MDASKDYKLKTPEPVKFLLAITSNQEKMATTVLNEFKTDFGIVDSQSGVFPFNHTNYYEKEMGSGLSKEFYSFKVINEPEYLAQMKIKATEIEGNSLTGGNRTVNIDPAYLELSKLVVASSKNFSHRIYIGKGVFGDIQLQYRAAKFIGNPWTYPDYLTSQSLSFFTKVRTIYQSQLKEEHVK